MENSSYKSKKHNPRLVTLLWYVRTVPRDRYNKPVAEVVETNAMGFLHLYLN